MRIPEAYELVEHEMIDECRSDGYLLSHKKTGARIFLMSNQDNNKVFTIGFRTPPKDSTGLPHILEHSVLCGSRKYPVKDPFIELEKSSLQTFLNAMTYPDKTIYPVASCNDKDFRNLMDVYMDAVLNPSIYREEKIFRQEGWHYEMENMESPLIVNGVVYNEMKGAFSSAEDVLDRYCQTVLYPDTPYTYESGGDPDDIPTLSYEDFLAFHSAYYHPSNSFIFLYGDMDMEEQLIWLDEEYLSHYEYREVASEIAEQKPFAAPVDVTIPYPIAPEEEEEDKTFLSVQWVTGDIRDAKLYVAFQILETVLLNAPGAPVKQALIDAGIGDDIYGGYSNSSLQPYFSIVAREANENQKEEFLEIVRRTLTDCAENGLNRKALLAAINSMDFKIREADFGSFPRGLMYGIECFDSWLYGGSPMTHLRTEETFRFLRDEMDHGYFEELIRKYLLDNAHAAVITLKPERGMTERKDAELAGKLAAIRDAMSEEEREEMVRRTRELKEYQSEPSDEAALATLPSLSLADIEPKVKPINCLEKKLAETPVLHQDIFTNGIYYMHIMFRADLVKKDDIPYLALLRSLFGMMPTEHYSYAELFSEINLVSGGISFGMPVYQFVNELDEFAPYMEIRGRVLGEHLTSAMGLMQEVLLRTNFRDEKRLREMLAQLKSRAITNLQNSGHSTAMLRASSYESRTSWFSDMTGGLGYGRFLEELQKAFEESSEAREALMERLEHLAASIFTQNGMLVSITTTEEEYPTFADALENFRKDFPTGEQMTAADPYRPSRAVWEILPERRNEGLKTAGQIQYVAKAGNFRKAGFAYTGALRVMRKILSDEYLWINVRVKGGAYGCMCGFGRSGSGYFVSYRDPNLQRTLDVYDGVASWLESLEVSERDMENYIIGTIGTMDHPMNPADLGAFYLSAYLGGITDEMRQIDRDQVLGCRVSDIRALAPLMRAIVDAGNLCVVGNGSKIEEASELFLNVESL